VMVFMVRVSKYFHIFRKVELILDELQNFRHVSTIVEITEIKREDLDDEITTSVECSRPVRLDRLLREAICCRRHQGEAGVCQL
jgi:hypothetical protein